jgi:hypothetical protein
MMIVRTEGILPQRPRRYALPEAQKAGGNP